MKNIILEELSKVKLLMNYNTKATLSENLINNEIFISNNNLITEQPVGAVLKSLFGTADELTIAALKKSKDARYLAAKNLFNDASILSQAGFKNADDLISAMAKGTLKSTQMSGIAKGLLKQGKVTGKLRTTLTNKAADITMKDARYANQSGSQIKTTLTKQKGYDPAIADEIAMKVSAKRSSKIPVNPKDIDDAVIQVPNVPKGKTTWQSLKKWGIGAGLTLGTIATLYYFFGGKEIPIIDPEEEEEQQPTPTPLPVTNRYRNCTGTYTKGCKTSPEGAIGQVQACLDLVQDGKFWVKTQAALELKGYNNGFTDADIPKICNKPEETEPEVGDEVETIDATTDDF
jgi:hypothetical protein